MKKNSEVHGRINVDEKLLKLGDLKVSAEKTKMSEADKKKALHGENNQGNYLTDNKRKK